MMIVVRLSALVIGFALLAACGDRPAQEGRADGDAAPFMVAVANPHAAEAAADILRRGGSAIDAAIAAQAVLSLVEPQSSGIGGGAFILYFDARTGQVRAFDGREMAPRSARPDMFLDGFGEPLSFADAAPGGLSVGVPGVVAALEQVHGEFGILPWAELFDEGIRLSEEGFEISPRLRFLITLVPWTAHMPDTRAYFYDDGGAPLEGGDLLQNPAHAESLRILAEGGAAAFYEGSLALAIAETVQTAPRNPAGMTIADLANYRAIEREAICRPYRAYMVCGMPPPTSGGVTVQMILSLLEGFDLSSLDPGSAEAVHLISEASRLAYADRDMYLADEDYVAVPVNGMLSPLYLAERASLINETSSMGLAEAGDPWPNDAPLRSPDLSDDVPGTSHIAIVDQAGNAISMTSSIESIFGSHLMVGGFFLNNQLTDFSFVPARDGRPVANAPAPGKRPRSSMSPTIILDAEGELFAVLGSGGGSRIPAYVVQAIIGLIDWELSMQEALNLPHHTNRNGRIDLEAETSIVDLAPALEAMGHEVQAQRLNSGSQGVRVIDGNPDGGADPRREGVTIGE